MTNRRTYFRKQIRFHAPLCLNEGDTTAHAVIIDHRKGQHDRVLAYFGSTQFDLKSLERWDAIHEWAYKCEQSAKPVLDRIINELLSHE